MPLASPAPPPRPASSHLISVSPAAAVSLACAIAVAFVLRTAPTYVLALLPACPIHRLTGLLCPGCGGTRALIALLHGDLLSAWHRNPLMLALSPLLLAYLLVTLRRGSAPRVSPLLTSALLALTLGFTVARNL